MTSLIRMTAAVVVAMSFMACSKSVKFAEKPAAVDIPSEGNLGNGPVTEVVEPGIPGDDSKPEPRGPSISIVKLPGDQSTDSHADIEYQIIAGDEPIKDVTCTLDDRVINCSEDGGTIRIPDGQNPGGHEVVIIVEDEGGKTDTEEVNWDVFKDVKYMSKTISVADQDDQVDVLFVVDNSGSMKQEQANMAGRFSSFMDKVQGMDWRIAITTTDTVHSVVGDGRLIQFSDGNYYLNSKLHSTSYAKSLFAQTIQRPEAGDGYEQGIRNTTRALARYKDGAHENAGFFRQKAALAVVVISDEDETGNLAINSGDNLISMVNFTFGADKLFQFHSIITRPGDKTCYDSQAQYSAVVYGAKYQSLSTKTGGIVGDICASDYGSQLNLIGQEVANLQKTYRLDCEPQDKDGDGNVDLIITSFDGSSVPNYSLNGTQIIFGSGLPVGDYNVSYYCAK